MIALFVYIVVTLILSFIFYLAAMGINRGIIAKNKNSKKKIFNKKDLSDNTLKELTNLKKLRDNGIIIKKKFQSKKKNIKPTRFFFE
tara:strand:- start:676 stop:936 length:261 start_codon:yes stop_codon:yes gene_type:complete